MAAVLYGQSADLLIKILLTVGKIIHFISMKRKSSEFFYFFIENRFMNVRDRIYLNDRSGC